MFYTNKLTIHPISNDKRRPFLKLHKITNEPKIYVYLRQNQGRHLLQINNYLSDSL